MKRYFLLTIAALAASLTYAITPLGAFLDARAVSAPSTAVLIKDLSSGETLVSHNAGKPLLPASIMKTATIAGLLREAGPDAKFHTRVYGDGDVYGNVLEGDIVVVGGGDPTLGANCAPASADIAGEITAALRGRGINVVKRDVVADISLYSGPACPPSWATGDLKEAYGTGSHALNFRRNSSGSRSVSNPASVFLSYLTAALRDAGISIEGDVRIESVSRGGLKETDLLVDHTSDSYAEVMRSCMMRSDNLFAETLLRAFALERGKEAATAEGAAEMLAYWKKDGVPVQGVSIVDGSGLSRSNRVTANFMGAILGRMADNEEYASFLPLAGQEGTLQDFLKDTHLDAYVAMKTGSMKGVQCYAGYKLDEQFAPTHLIVIIMNDIGPRAAARKAAEQLLMDVFPES